ncbi:hypothetical protein N9250_03080 [bacterium]|nr:hypothetical protein [bacterium]
MLRKFPMLVESAVQAESRQQELEVRPGIEDVTRTAYQDFVMFYPLPVAPTRELRKWSDYTGKFNTEAKLVVQITGNVSETF